MLPFNAKGIGLPLAYREDFLKANRTYGAYYWNGNGDPNDSINWEYDETSPRYRTFIITEKARLDEIFSVYPAVDFEKEMVVMYVYTSTHGGGIKITSVTLVGKNLKIDFKPARGKPGYNNETTPQTSFLALRMDKLDIDTVEFNLLRR